MKEKELVKELVKDWAEGKLSSYSAMFTLHMIVNKQKKPSKEFRQWAMNSIKENK